MSLSRISSAGVAREPAPRRPRAGLFPYGFGHSPTTQSQGFSKGHTLASLAVRRFRWLREGGSLNARARRYSTSWASAPMSIALGCPACGRNDLSFGAQDMDTALVKDTEPACTRSLRTFGASLSRFSNTDKPKQNVPRARRLVRMCGCCPTDLLTHVSSSLLPLLHRHFYALPQDKHGDREGGAPGPDQGRLV